MNRLEVVYKNVKLVEVCKKTGDQGFRYKEDDSKCEDKGMIWLCGPYVAFFAVIGDVGDILFKPFTCCDRYTFYKYECNA